MKYRSMACGSFRSLHHSKPTSSFGSRANDRLPSGRVYAHESSITAQPEREIRPFSSSARLLSPSLPSSVRHVPLRFRGSGLPGYHTTSCPLCGMVMVRFSGEAGSVAGFVPLRYLSLSRSVSMYRKSLSSFCVKDGTASISLFWMANVARSSKRPLSLYSRRIISGVSTVKRALPERTVASSRATGFCAPAANPLTALRMHRNRKPKFPKQNGFFMLLLIMTVYLDGI